MKLIWLPQGRCFSLPLHWCFVSDLMWHTVRWYRKWLTLNCIPLCERSQKKGDYWKFRFLEMSELVYIFAERKSRITLLLSNIPSATTLRGLTGDLNNTDHLATFKCSAWKPRILAFHSDMNHPPKPAVNMDCCCRKGVCSVCNCVWVSGGACQVASLVPGPKASQQSTAL